MVSNDCGVLLEQLRRAVSTYREAPGLSRRSVSQVLGCLGSAGKPSGLVVLLPLEPGAWWFCIRTQPGGFFGVCLCRGWSAVNSEGSTKEGVLWKLPMPEKGHCAAHCAALQASRDCQRCWGEGGAGGVCSVTLGKQNRGRRGKSEPGWHSGWLLKETLVALGLCCSSQHVHTCRAGSLVKEVRN